MHSPDDLPLSFAFNIRTNPASETKIILGQRSRHFELKDKQLPRSEAANSRVVLEAEISDVHNVKTAARKEMYLQKPNRTEVLEYLNNDVEEVIEEQAQQQDWSSFLDIIALAGNEYVEQIQFEYMIFQLFNASSTFNSTTQYAQDELRTRTGGESLIRLRRLLAIEVQFSDRVLQKKSTSVCICGLQSF